MRIRTNPPIVCLGLTTGLIAFAMAVAGCTTEPGSSSTGGTTGQAGGSGGGKGGSGGAAGSSSETKGTGGSTTGKGGSTTVGTGGVAGTTGAGGTSGPGDAAVSDAIQTPIDTAPDGGGSGGGATRWPKCLPIFDGKTTAGWGGMDGFKITPDGVMAGLGKGGQNYTVKDYKDFRWIFSLRNVPGTEHNPSIIMWGHNRQRGFAGIQVQAPTCGGWDYRAGKNTALGPLKCSGGGIDKSKWAQCEFLANSAESKIQMACCQQDAGGTKPCKGVKILEYVDPTAPNLGAIGFMLHNPGIFDEFKDICLEENPTENVLITTQYTPP